MLILMANRDGRFPEHCCVYAGEKRMRRQLKPFVTEYRGTGRRGREPLALRGEPEAPRVADPGQDVFRTERARPDRSKTEGSVGGYEAALKAADALFAVRKPAQASAQSEADPFSTDANGAAPDAALASSVGGPAGRRILQAIDQPASQPVAGQSDAVRPGVAHPGPAQAEPALCDAAADYVVAKPSARRGRKPGMKNKPKPDASLVVEADIAGDDRPEQAAPDLVLVDALPDHRRRDPFPWVRTRLGPGEKWKRRLPKVAW